MMKRRMLLVFLLVVLSGFFFFHAYAKPAPPTPEAIRIGSAISLTGRNASMGRELLRGYEIGIDDVNQAGGLFVKEFNKKIPLKLITLDDESDAVKTVSKMEALYLVHHIHFYFGGGGTNLHLAGIPIAEKYKVPYLMAASGLYALHQKGYKYLFGVTQKSPQNIDSLFKLLESVPSEERPTKIAIFREQSEVGIESAEAIHEKAPKYGYKVVNDIRYAPGTKDYSPMILAAKATGANSFFSYPIPPDAITMIKQIKELGWNANFYSMIRGCGPEQWADLGSVGDYVCYAGVSHPSLPYPGMAEFVAKQLKRYNVREVAQAANAYAMVQIIAAAIGKAGTLDRDKVRDALAATNIMTIIGPVRFDPDGSPIMRDNVLQWKGGKSELVWPQEYRTAPFIYPALPWAKR